MLSDVKELGAFVVVLGARGDTIDIDIGTIQILKEGHLAGPAKQLVYILKYQVKEIQTV